MVETKHDFNSIKPIHFFNDVEGVVEDFGVVVGIVVGIGVVVPVKEFSSLNVAITI